MFDVELKESAMQPPQRQNTPDEQQPEGSGHPITDTSSTPDR